jgi:prepilin-type N-terminal cleavage/methylation domain-containing protein
MMASGGVCWSKPLNAGIYDGDTLSSFKGDRGMKISTMDHKKKKNGEKGFTLIEVLVAMAVFAVGILAAVHMQSSALMTNKLARNSTEALTQAADLLERLTALPYTDTNLNPGTHNVGVPLGVPDWREGPCSMWTGGNLTSDIEQYRFQYIVALDAMFPNTKTVTVRVWYLYRGNSWAIGSPDTREVVLVSVKPNN